jgi:hypothetical protein
MIQCSFIINETWKIWLRYESHMTGSLHCMKNCVFTAPNHVQKVMQGGGGVGEESVTQFGIIHAKADLDKLLFRGNDGME